MKKPTIKIFRWDAEEIRDENGVLIGYADNQTPYRKERYLDTYDVIIWGDLSQRERLRATRPNNLRSSKLS